MDIENKSGKRTHRSKYDIIDTEKVKQCTKCLVFREKEEFISPTGRECRLCEKCRAMFRERTKQKRLNMDFNKRTLIK